MPGRRIVLLEMATEDAEAFVRDTVTNGGVMYGNSDDPTNFSATVEAVVARPTRWCTCAIAAESKYQRRRRMAQKRESGWTRGRTFGWWLCVHCKKPSKPVVIHWVSSMLAGANDLLPGILSGTGEGITPSNRWQRDGGAENPGANANSAHVKSLAGAESRQARKRATRERRSDVDRKAAMARRNADLAARRSEAN